MKQGLHHNQTKGFICLFKDHKCIYSKRFTDRSQRRKFIYESYEKVYCAENKSLYYITITLDDDNKL